MTPLLLFPAALGAVVTLALPLAIHLSRRSELRRIDFAALRWLSARPRPRTRLRFDERLLLAVRLLLLALIALWLARPAVEGATDETPWVAVVPGASNAVVPPGAHCVWLAPGFPSLDRPAPGGPIAVSSLLRQLDAELPRGVRLTVVVPPEITADAERLHLSRAVVWRIVGGFMSSRRPTAAPPNGLIIRYAGGREDAARYVRLAAAAWQAPGHAPDIDIAPASQPLPQTNWPLVWLVPESVPAALLDRVQHGDTILLDVAATTDIAMDTAWADAVGKPLVMSAALGRGRILRLQRRLGSRAMPELLEPDFAARLASLLAQPSPAPTRVAARNVAPTADGPAYTPPAQDLRPWLALLIAAVFFVERLLASGRRVRVTA